jgi:hypothetical protein
MFTCARVCVSLSLSLSLSLALALTPSLSCSLALAAPGRWYGMARKRWERKSARS